MNIVRYLPFVICSLTLLGVGVSVADQAADPQPLAGQPGGPSQAERLLGALASLEGLIEAEVEPSVEQVAPLKQVIDACKASFGTSAATIKAAFGVVGTYDRIKGPLFVAHGGWDKGHRRKPTPPAEDIHWTIYHVMQYIMDSVYTAENIERYSELLDGFSFGSSAYFPGPVGVEPDPEQIHTVKVNASAPEVVSFTPYGPPRRPTGAYVAPGTIVTVTVPESIVGKGYTIRVGAHSWDNEPKRRVTRLARASLVYDIDQSVIRVANPLGGGIYIEVPVGADAGVVDVSFKNAVRSPFFSAKSFDRTSLKEWLEVERERQVPWADFETDKFLMNVPTMWIHKLEYPVTLMQNWDKVMDLLNDFYGQPHICTRHTMYLQVDLQNRGNAFFPGYPTCNDRYDPLKADEYAGYADHYLVRGPQEAPSYVFHEQGHAFNFVKYDGDREAAVNLPGVMVQNKGFGVDIEEAFVGKERTCDMVAITWMTCDAFLTGEGMLTHLRKYQPKGHAKYVDIARLFGWDVLAKFYGSYMQDVEDGSFKGRHSYSNDEITLRKCQVSGRDLRPLLSFWGIVENDPEALAKAVGDAGAVPAAQIYDLLLHYKSVVPKDNAAFRKHALAWWKKEPSPEGFTTERNHAAYWETYNEETAEQIQNVIQQIIERYFPNGRPD